MIKLLENLMLNMMSAEEEQNLIASLSDQS